MGEAAEVAEPPTLYCANHPATETLLRCSKCGKPICVRCGIQTPVGIRCRECAQLRRAPSYVLGPQHFGLAAIVALPASFVAGLVMQYVGPFLAFFLGGAVGGLIAEAVYRATGGKRGRPLGLLVSASILVGALLSALGPAVLWQGVPLTALLDPGLLFGMLARNLIYVVLAIGAAFARLS